MLADFFPLVRSEDKETESDSNTDINLATSTADSADTRVEKEGDDSVVVLDPERPQHARRAPQVVAFLTDWTRVVAYMQALHKAGQSQLRLQRLWSSSQVSLLIIRRRTFKRLVAGGRRRKGISQSIVDPLLRLKTESRSGCVVKRGPGEAESERHGLSGFTANGLVSFAACARLALNSRARYCSTLPFTF